MLSRHQHKMLVEGIESLALENIMYHVEKDRHLFDYSAAIVNFHKKLVENKLEETFDYDYYLYDFRTLIAESINKNTFSNSDIKAINKMKNITSDITNRILNGYVFKPNHVYESNGILKIDWSKFNIKQHIRFIKESISVEAIAICDFRVMNGFWDGSHHLLKEGKKTLLSEGGALRCEKQNYKKARRVFKETRLEILDVLTKNGFIVENVYDAGSLRRKKSLVGDIDLIVNVLGHEKANRIEKHPLEERRFLEQYSFLFHNTLKRNIDSEMIRSYKTITQFIKEGTQCDVFFCTPTSIPTRRCYWTGSAAHNVKMMYEGFKKDVLFSFDYLYDKNRGKFLMPKNERQVFSVLGIDYIEPEFRK